MIKMRWQAWYGDTELSLALPADWQVETCPLPDLPAMGADAVLAALRSPLGTVPLVGLARARHSAAVVVEDMTRPLPTAEVLPELLAELARGGLGPEAVSVIVGLGCHTPLHRPALLRKLGRDVVERYTVYQHSPYQNLAYLGVTQRGTPIHIDRFFLAAELRIALGTLSPHEYVGFGGGAKLVAVGLGGLETIAANHARAAAGEAAGAGVLQESACRADMEEIAVRAGLCFLVNGVVNGRRTLAGLWAGDPRQVYTAGAAQAHDWYATALPDQVDIAVFNAYPKDTDLLQASNALNVAGHRLEHLVRPGGTLVIIAACPEGLGWHALGSPGMPAPYIYDPDRDFGGRGLIVVSPNLALPELRSVYPCGTTLAASWDAAVAELARRHPGSPRVAVFPSGTLQVDAGPEIALRPRRGVPSHPL